MQRVRGKEMMKRAAGDIPCDFDPTAETRYPSCTATPRDSAIVSRSDWGDVGRNDTDLALPNLWTWWMMIFPARALLRVRGDVPSRRLFCSSPALRHADQASVVFNGRSYPYIWLRDSCQCPSCVHPSTRQKLHRSSDFDPKLEPRENEVVVAQDGLTITWGSGHRSHYPAEFLNRYASRRALEAFHRDVDRVEWDRERVKSARDLFVPYESLGTPEGLLAAITQLSRYGLIFVTSVPNERTSNEDCELRKLGERFGELRTTFYGETWDVKNIKNSRNIAYTNVDLGLHMDLLYFQHPPRYQILHCLRNRVEGGKSIFVDAAHVASKLRTADPDAFATLASTPVDFHYINDGHHLHHSHPTIQLSRFPALGSPPAIDYINYSPPFQAPLPIDTPAAFYPALKRFASMLDDPEVQFEYLLREGDAVLFDNRRVLHARTAFRQRDGEESADGETDRWLKGCYLEADAVLDRGRVLRKQLDGGRR